jgi:putative oxidoreductase
MRAVAVSVIPVAIGIQVYRRRRALAEDNTTASEAAPA